jgi:hypothetical protein
MMGFIRVLGFAAALLLNAKGERIHLWLVAGQSNATPLLSEGARRVFAADESYRRTRMVLSYHPGSAIHFWSLDGEPGPNYASDLAALSGEMEQVRAGGDIPVFEGILWMQGESDTTNSSAVSRYGARFHDMLEQYRVDLQLAVLPRFAMGITDANRSELYDDPARLGTSREMVEALRQEQARITEALNGIAVDSRDMARYDAWHLSPAASLDLGGRLASSFIGRFTVTPSWAVDRDSKSAGKSFRGIDRDRDGMISFEELMLRMRADKKARKLWKKFGDDAPFLVEGTVYGFFAWFDADMNSYIDRDEWLQGCTIPASEATPDPSLFPSPAWDRNADGTRSFGEFRWMASGLVPLQRLREWHPAIVE